MRHKRGNKKLNRPTDQRIALLRALVRSLFLNNRIQTTDVRAKEASKMADQLISLGKRGDLVSRRRAVQILPDTQVISDLFTSIAPKYKERNGGYTRTVKLGFRRGDAAPVSLLELVD